MLSGVKGSNNQPFLTPSNIPQIPDISRRFPSYFT